MSQVYEQKLLLIDMSRLLKKRSYIIISSCRQPQIRTRLDISNSSICSVVHQIPLRKSHTKTFAVSGTNFVTKKTHLRRKLQAKSYHSSHSPKACFLTKHFILYIVAAASMVSFVTKMVFALVESATPFLSTT